MNDLAIVIYTHTDMEDIWNSFFSRLDNFLGSHNGYVIINKHSDLIPEKYKQLYYDDNNLYTDRLYEVLDHIKESVILFLHEDMIMYDYADINLLSRCIDHIKSDRARSIKLIYADLGNVKSDFDELLTKSIFSVQPTIIKTESFKKLISEHRSLSIWDFEKSIKNSDKDYMFKLGTENKRGLFHYDSIIFPYIATAITKGKWNYSEYQNELHDLFEEFKIDHKKRGLQ